MEQEPLTALVPSPEQAQFERVWRRVAPTDRPDCPITLYSEEAHRLMPGEEDSAWPREAPVGENIETIVPPPAPLPAPFMQTPEEDVPCLGAASRVHGPMLQAFIADELSDRRTYSAMAQRVRGNAAAVLTELSRDELRHAKRLAAAYFLLSGIHYWPDRLPGAPTGLFLTALRTRFAAEQRGAGAYRGAAGGTQDPYLRVLFLTLAEDEEGHAQMLRQILEQ